MTLEVPDPVLNSFLCEHAIEKIHESGSSMSPLVSKLLVVAHPLRQILNVVRDNSSLDC